MHKVPTHFDRVAVVYPWLEQAVFGTALNRARASSLPAARTAQSVLLVGEGNGRFLHHLLPALRSGCRVTVADSSAGMLRAAARRCRARRGDVDVAFLHADARRLPELGVPFDLIVTHFFFDLYEPRSQAAVIAGVTRNAAKRAVWCDVDFVEAPPRRFQRSLMWVQYRFFRVVTGLEATRLHDPRPLFEQHAWKARSDTLQRRGMVRVRCWERCLDERLVPVHV
ncbi:MAG TPA: class I SAM-dependent methyltransferase [Chthoniobacterales bacterium]